MILASFPCHCPVLQAVNVKVVSQFFAAMFLGLPCSLETRLKFGLGMRLKFGLGMRLKFGLGMRLKFGLGMRLKFGLGMRLKFGLGTRLKFVYEGNVVNNCSVKLKFLRCKLNPISGR